MDLNLNKQEYRLLLDLAYIGNWILNSARGNDRIMEYDALQQKLFSHAQEAGLRSLAVNYAGVSLPSDAYVNGGIHEAIADYEDSVFFNILAEELARRDLGLETTDPDDFSELTAHMDEYLDEFERNGLNSIKIDL